MKYWDRSWNPITGCESISAGCERCWAAGVEKRFPHVTAGRGFVPGTFHPERLAEPLKWRPRKDGKRDRVAVCWMGDLFHHEVALEHLGAIFGVMATVDWVDWLVLTKRPYTMRAGLQALRRALGGPGAAGAWTARAYIEGTGSWKDEAAWAKRLTKRWPVPWNNAPWPPQHIYLGTSAESQLTWDTRVNDLMSLALDGWRVWVSAEPLLDGIDTERCLPRWMLPRLSWVVVGSETGPGARDPEDVWARLLVQQCQEADVPVLVKQWPRDLGPEHVQQYPKAA